MSVVSNDFFFSQILSPSCGQISVVLTLLVVSEQALNFQHSCFHVEMGIGMLSACLMVK